MSQANRLGTEIAAYGRKSDKWVKDPDGTEHIRFDHSGLGLPKQWDKRKQGLRDRYLGKSKMPKKMPIELANLTNKKAIEFAERCDKAGMPPLRSFTNVRSASWASMGDGVLAMSGKHIDDLASYKAPEIALKEAREGWKASLDYHVLTLERVESGQYTNVSAEVLKETKKEIRRLKKLLKDDNAGLEKIGRAASSWKFGDGPSKKPFNSAYYFASVEEQWESTLEHEFSHHIHQTLGVTDIGSYQYPPMEARLIQLHKTHGENATLYAEGQGANRPPMEWFAENRSLWKMGREDIVDQTIKPLMKELDDMGL